jgi:hypothetical protein
MHRSQQRLQCPRATLMFAVASFAQDEHVPNLPGFKR